ncbi:hypothetical protein AALO_G00242690 [Alosa alosa]|uniref:Uncharacterized protein n=1 Tax=Alosa alosa TaxID=278164 RepID=A0AAV6FUR5_9TELE|nr:hypothetical protein AALO_G00242690 [Alosa alosa]
MAATRIAMAAAVSRSHSNNVIVTCEEWLSRAGTPNYCSCHNYSTITDLNNSSYIHYNTTTIYISSCYNIWSNNFISIRHNCNPNYYSRYHHICPFFNTCFNIYPCNNSRYHHTCTFDNNSH